MKLIKNSTFKNAQDRNVIYNIQQHNRFFSIEEYQEIMIPLFENETQKSLTHDQISFERLFQRQGEQQQFPIPFYLKIDYITHSYFEFEVEELKFRRVDIGQQWKFRHFNEYLTFLNTTLNFVSVYVQKTDDNRILHSLGVIKQNKLKAFDNIICRGKLYIPRTKYFAENIYQEEMNIYIQPLGSTTTYFTESMALNSIRNNPQANSIIGNVPELHQIQNNQLNSFIENPIFKNHFNKYQIKGILQAHQSNQLFTLIDGPPGTGKTQTTLGLISTSFRLSPNPDEVILILARTNTVVNDLVRRLKKSIHDEKSIFNFDNRLKGFPWKIMRTGRADKCDEDIKENSMEIMGQLAFFREYQTKLSEKCQQLIKKYELNSITTVDLLDRIEKECRLGRRTQLNQVKLEEMGQIYLEMQSLQKKYMDQVQVMQSKELNRCNILVSTLNSCHQDVVYSYLSKKQIKFCIIDEAPTALESSMLIPITKYPQIRKFVLLGDVKQLNPFIAAQESQTYGFNKSMFERFSQLISPIQLKIQYRQVPILANITSQLFYDNQLLASESVEVPNYLSNLISKDAACIFFNSKNQHAEELVETSFKNESEAQAIVALVQYLLTDIDKFTQPGSKRLISIIVAYRNQYRYLRNLLSNTTNRFNEYLIDYVEIDTIDAFQGKENDVVIVSLVRSGDNMGFLRDKKRMNVALSRARFAQFIFGNKKCLLTTLTKWKKLLDYLKQENQMIDYPDNANYQYFKQILQQQNIINYVRELVHKKNKEIFFTSNNEIMDNVGTNIEAQQIFELIRYIFSNVTEENSQLFQNNKIITIVFASEQQLNIVRAILQANTLVMLNKKISELVRLRTFQTFEGVQNLIIIVSLFNGNQIGFLEHIELGKEDKTYAKCGIFIFGKTKQLENSSGKWNNYLTNLQANNNIIQYNNRLSIENIGFILQRS